MQNCQISALTENVVWAGHDLEVWVTQGNQNTLHPSVTTNLIYGNSSLFLPLFLVITKNTNQPHTQQEL
jgi:hypothetical protein